MIYNKSFALAISFALCCAIASCSSGVGSSSAEGSADSLPSETVEAATDSTNSVPVFYDEDGRLDSIFSARGYHFGADIVRASKDGNEDASFILAQMYSYGIAGATPNRRKAYKLYVNLADNGNNEAKASAGYMLMHGMGTEAEPSKGLAMMADAANAGCATAYLLMGNFYSESEPTPENIANAKLCYAQARDLGIVEAEVLLKKLE